MSPKYQSNASHVIHNATIVFSSYEILPDKCLQLYAGLLMALLNLQLSIRLFVNTRILASDPSLSLLDNVGTSVISVSCVFDIVTARVSPLK